MFCPSHEWKPFQWNLSPKHQFGIHSSCKASLIDCLKCILRSLHIVFPLFLCWGICLWDCLKVHHLLLRLWLHFHYSCIREEEVQILQVRFESLDLILVQQRDLYWLQLVLFQVIQWFMHLLWSILKWDLYISLNRPILRFEVLNICRQDWVWYLIFQMLSPFYLRILSNFWFQQPWLLHSMLFLLWWCT